MPIGTVHLGVDENQIVRLVGPARPKIGQQLLLAHVAKRRHKLAARNVYESDFLYHSLEHHLHGLAGARRQVAPFPAREGHISVKVAGHNAVATIGAAAGTTTTTTTTTTPAIAALVNEGTELSKLPVARLVTLDQHPLGRAAQQVAHGRRNVAGKKMHAAVTRHGNLSVQCPAVDGKHLAEELVAKAQLARRRDGVPGENE